MMPPIVLASSLTLTGGNDTIDGGPGIDPAGEPSAFTCLNVQSAGNTIRNMLFTDCNVAIDLSLVASDNNVIGPGNTLFDNNFAISISNGANGNSVVGNKI